MSESSWSYITCLFLPTIPDPKVKSLSKSISIPKDIKPKEIQIIVDVRDQRTDFPKTFLQFLKKTIIRKIENIEEMSSCNVEALTMERFSSVITFISQLHPIPELHGREKKFGNQESIIKVWDEMINVLSPVMYLIVC